MKLVEIKNNLAKLYYENSDFKIVLSDFLTIDDGNQKILAQVVSIETTSKDTTNCAVLKFSLDLNDDGSFSSYSGYVPTLDALVSKTPPKVIQNIFSDSENEIVIGQLTSSTNLQMSLKSSLLDTFLYIQSDKRDNKKEILSKILEFNQQNENKTIYLDFEDLGDFSQYPSITLGKEFKLPIDSEILNYIYENDLTGLTVEQKTIIQDIILEIQEYIESLETGFIPFDTLLNVVNEIYEEDKSVGVILFRNKLLKYKQANIFASTLEEIISIEKAFKQNVVTIVKLHKPDTNWKNEAISFILNFFEENYQLVVEADDEILTKEQLAEIYKNKNIKPIILSKYDTEKASTIKAYAKNLILYKPLVQQRAFATYNSFLNKLSEKEFIVSGECTYFTPLIIKELADKFVVAEKELIKQEEESIEQQIQEIQTEAAQPEEITLEPVDEEIAEDIEQNIGLDEDDLDLIESANNNYLLEENDIEELIGLDEAEEDAVQIEEQEENSNIANILEESIEDEIAKDVDQMFYAEGNETSLDALTDSEENEEDKLVNIDVELVNTIEADDDMLEDDLFNEEPTQDIEQEFAIEDNTDEMLLENDLDFIDSLEEKHEIDEPDILEETQKTYVDIDPIDSFEPIPQVSKQSSKAGQSKISNIPVYKTELDNITTQENQIEIVEGNIVYHEKYGRGVVEQFMNYGNKTFCSILFDNVGRRLMDPKLAGLKQM